MRRPRQPFAPAPIGLLRHDPDEAGLRHCHDHGYMTLVLSGGYFEAGDEGRRRVGSGDVLVHQPFESHFSHVNIQGAEVLVLPLPETPVAVRYARTDKVEEVVRLAETSPADAAQLLSENLADLGAEMLDWPDLLAKRLRSRPSTCLERWAEEYRLSPETVSRGFRLAFRTTPSLYRATSRARKAWSACLATKTPLAELAAELGFADQAHMTRAVSDLTGLPPGMWRRRASGFKTSACAAL